jgi:vitamin B12 transporter
MFSKILVAVFFFTSFFIDGLAQNHSVQKDDSTGYYKLSEVVVTATRTKTPEIQLANSISVIDSSDIAVKNKDNIFDLLKVEPGISMTQQGGPGGLSNVYIRGGDPGHTLVLIDGTEMNMPSDPANTFDFSNLPTDNILRIEILRGPQSTLYGSDAMTGVINIITKQGFGKPKLFLSTEGGSYNTYKGLLGTNGKLSVFNYSITLSKKRTDGFSSASSRYGNTEKDGYSDYNVSSNLGASLTRNVELKFFQRYNKSNADYDQHGGAMGDDPTYKYNSEEQTYRLESNLKLLNNLWNQKIGVSFFRNVRNYNYDSILFHPYSANSIYDGRRIKFDWENNFSFNPDFISTLGIEYGSDSYSSLSSGDFQSKFPEASAQTAGVYLQQQAKFGENFFNTAGVRYDQHSKFGGEITYRVAPSYMLWETGTKFKATLGTGFKAPSLFYLFTPVYGNSDLKPEKNIGWDVGIEQYLLRDNLSIGLTYFNNSFKDLFGLDSNYKTINIDKAFSEGIEFYFNEQPNKQFSFSGNFTYTNTKDKSPGSPDENLPLIRRPKYRAALSGNYYFSKDISFNTEIIYVGKSYDKNFNLFPAERVVLPDYTIVNLSATYQIIPQIKLYGRIDNLFNKYYEEVYGYGTPGFSGYMGLTLSI